MSRLQDNASPHTAHSTKDMFKLFSMTLVEDWPAQSPDLNVIENLWGILTSKLANRQFNGEVELRDAVEREWNSIEPKTLQNLIDSWPKRLEECITKGGDCTSY